MIWDDTLTKRIIRGDRAAFEICYRQLSPFVYSAIYKTCQDKELSKDIVQETFLTAYQKANELNHDTNMLAWLKRVAFNKVINTLKRRNKFDDDNDAQDKTDNGDAIETLVENERLFLFILSKVSLSERIILWLYFVEQYKHHEIAELMGKSLSYSKLVVSRTVSTLKKSPALAEVINA